LSLLANMSAMSCLATVVVDCGSGNALSIQPLSPSD
jgi:hypothetical protein